MHDVLGNDRTNLHGLAWTNLHGLIWTNSCVLPWTATLHARVFNYSNLFIKTSLQ